MMIRIASLGIGYSFLALGVVGLFVPILQGILFLVLGLVVLSRHEPWAQRTLLRMKDRFPRARGAIDRAESLSRRWLRLAVVRVRRLGRFFGATRAS